MNPCVPGASPGEWIGARHPAAAEDQDPVRGQQAQVALTMALAKAPRRRPDEPVASLT
jgi:hypothetical protein